MISIKRTAIATSLIALLGTVSAHAATPADLAIANEEKLIEMLIQRGDIAPDATSQQKQQALEAYLAKKANKGFHGDAQFDKQALLNRANVLKQMKMPGHAHGPSIFALDLSQKRTDKVLALLVDFPDLPWDDNRLTSEHTEMLYDSYSNEHYQNLLFSGEGYTGPNGENLISMRQYYEQESGNTYSVSGQAFGWYRASQNAAYYGGNSPTTDNDLRAQDLVREALDQLAKDPNINLADYDIEDRYDYDGDGNFREPDGVIDHLMVFHASVGEEAGGGVLNENAIWSHRFNLGQPHILTGTSSQVPGRFNGQYAAFDYTIQPIDAAAGVCAHEYGHDLGLPDEYDTKYTGQGEPVSYWSIMSSGSWAGQIGGTQPTAFSGWAKTFLQSAIGGNWILDSTLSLEELKGQSHTITLSETVNNDAMNLVRINLPRKQVDGVAPFAGDYQFYSQKGDDLRTSMSREITLPSAGRISLDFKAWFQIETDYDFARVLVNGQQIAGSITTMNDPLNTGLVPAVTGSSEGWTDAKFDLTPWAGQTITLSFDYITDGGLAEEGFYLDQMTVTADESVVFSADAETEDQFVFTGYTRNQGFHEADQYYLLQWRSHQDVDQGLANIKRMGQLMTFEPGLIVWYVDESMTDNWVGEHPGAGWLGVVDADQATLKWSQTGEPATTRYQVRDAAFSLQDQAPLRLVNNDDVLEDPSLIANASFNDGADYTSPEIPDAGRQLAQFGISIDVVRQADDNRYGVIRISAEADNAAPEANFTYLSRHKRVDFVNQSLDSDGEITGVQWDFGDGATSTEANPSHRYQHFGRYTVTLTVTDNSGATSSTQQVVELEPRNQKPVAEAGYFNLGRMAMLWSESSDSDGHIVDTKWVFPDGSVQKGGVAFHLFEQRGKQKVQLIVTDNQGKKARKTIILDI
ncbi:immune inhibitor A domain-containing protein [Photobacterium sp. TY1-4]|uniref:immune inhibitor A domain-containing protein n=1 Tax=Photobacterium sp. TY1-4 TaxID=2899122 RepID=UPI0021BF07FD|nr:immune inhibitor A domain-containing protein [Photobacterium sp. TY1-4]UXI03271.1 immune inhibitor A [Photobacterium sp. TY1-4]